MIAEHSVPLLQSTYDLMNADAATDPQAAEAVAAWSRREFAADAYPRPLDEVLKGAERARQGADPTGLLRSEDHDSPPMPQLRSSPMCVSTAQDVLERLCRG